MESMQERRMIKAAAKQVTLQIRKLGLMAMLTDKDSVNKFIASTILLSHSRDLIRDFNEEQFSTILNWRLVISLATIF